MSAVIKDTEGAQVHGYIRTYTGERVFIHEPEVTLREGAINVKDIAHALSLQCRYNGHCREFYSVAQHSVLASDEASPIDKLWALLHDAPEAYMGDLVGPLKAKVDMWKPLEHRWDLALRRRFGVWPSPDYADSHHIEAQERRVKIIDLLLLGREMKDLFPGRDVKSIGFLDERRPDDLPSVSPWPPKKAKRLFLRRFYKLTGQKLRWLGTFLGLY